MGSPEQQEVTEAIQTVLYEFTREQNHIAAGDAVCVNSGYCRVFAGRVVERLGPSFEITRYDAWWVHSWLECNGLHYDAEHPKGVADPTEFAIWERVTDEEYQLAADNCDILSTTNS